MSQYALSDTYSTRTRPYKHVHKHRHVFVRSWSHIQAHRTQRTGNNSEHTSIRDSATLRSEETYAQTPHTDIISLQATHTRASTPAYMTNGSSQEPHTDSVSLSEAHTQTRKAAYRRKPHTQTRMRTENHLHKRIQFFA